MSYLTEARRAYDEFNKTNFKNLFGSSSKDYEKVLASIQDRFGFELLRQSYEEDIKPTIVKYLPFFKDEIQNFLQLQEVKYYQKNIPLRTLSLLMWIWEKDLDISEAKLKKFVDSLFLGTFGYKMVDVNSDNTKSFAEISLVGFYLIKLAEQLLAEVFGYNNTNEALSKYFLMYVETELLEKRNRWKDCPFSWNEAQLLGHKGAPIYAVYEVLFNYAGFSPLKTKQLIESIIYASAAIQLIDDIADAKLDLSNGYETLVMKNFYTTFGLNSEITDDKINSILNQQRLKLIYKTGQELFDKARKLLEKHDEYIIQLSLEMSNFNFTTIFKLK